MLSGRKLTVIEGAGGLMLADRVQGLVYPEIETTVSA
jgi:hypothetical protein